MLKTQRLIILSITLRYRQPVVDIIKPHPIISDISHQPSTATAAESSGLRGVGVRPDFDAGAFGGVVHIDVCHEDVLDVARLKVG